MCKKCLTMCIGFLIVVIFGFFFIFHSSARGAAPTSPIINEIAWAGSTDSPNNEWIELYNPSDETFALKGWKLQAADDSPSIALEGELPSGGYFLLERTDDNSVPSVKANQIYTGSLDNKGEDLKLIDASGIVRDEVDASQGWQAGDNKTKATMARDDSNLAVVRWGNGPVNGTPLVQNVLVAAPAKQTPDSAQTVAQKTATKTSKQTKTQSGTPTTTPDAAAIAAFNARVQEATRNDSSLGTAKNVAGAMALLLIGALAAYTIIKKTKKRF